MTERMTGASGTISNPAFTNFERYRQPAEQGVTFITRAKKNLSYRRYRIFARRAAVHDYGIVVNNGEQRLRFRLVEIHRQGRWHRYLTNELDPQHLPVLYPVALYWQRWRIEDAYKQVKRLLGSAYFRVGSDTGVALQLPDNLAAGRRFGRFERRSCR